MPGYRRSGSGRSTPPPRQLQRKTCNTLNAADSVGRAEEIPRSTVFCHNHMAHSTWTRARFACALTLAAALLLALAAPAGAISRKQASKRALAALGSKTGSGSVIVFGLKKSLRSGTRITQGITSKDSRLVI